MRRILSFVLVAACVFMACVPPEPDNDRRIAYKLDTVMGEVQDRGVLSVAVPNDLPPFSSVENGRLDSEEPEGFFVDLAHMLADELFVDIEFTTAPAAEIPQLVTDEEVDVGFPLLPLTEAAFADPDGKGPEHAPFTPADPFLVDHQRLMAPGSADIDGLEDLSGKTVCAFLDPETGVALDEIDDSIGVVPASNIDACGDLLEGAGVDAITATTAWFYVLLARSQGFPPLLSRNPTASWEVTGPQISTVGYGPIVPFGDAGFADYIDETLGEAKLEGRWTESYDKWVGPYTSEPIPDPPDLTAEEAAALWPEGFAP